MTVLQLSTAFNDLSGLLTETKKYEFSEHTVEETAQLAKDMVESLYHYKGLGISANQLGLPWSVFAMRGIDEDIVCFNPVIAQLGEEAVKLDEGCLSLPGIFMKINRAKHLRVRYTNFKNETDSFTYTGMTARVFQHEMDHLAGKLFFEGCNRLHLEKSLRKAKNKGFDYSQFGFMKYARH